jgi:hypothetical protein
LEVLLGQMAIREFPWPISFGDAQPAAETFPYSLSYLEVALMYFISFLLHYGYHD